MSEDRLRNAALSQNDGREDRAQESQRGARGSRERPDSSEDDLRMDTFRQQLFETTLPTIPPIPGYHVIWLTTTNPRDSIHRRQLIGYEPITPEECPELAHMVGQKDAKRTDRLITCNEMVAFKIRQDLYEKYMMEVHHNQPMAEEERLDQAIEAMKDGAARHKGGIVVEEGSARLANRRRAPTFT